jgi:hypothetical protein
VRAHDWGDVAGLVFVLALFMILTRASSNAPTIIAHLGGAFAKIISFATDSGTAGASAASAAGSALGSLG